MCMAVVSQLLVILEIPCHPGLEAQQLRLLGPDSHTKTLILVVLAARTVMPIPEMTTMMMMIVITTRMVTTINHIHIIIFIIIVTIIMRYLHSLRIQLRTTVPQPCTQRDEENTAHVPTTATRCHTADADHPA